MKLLSRIPLTPSIALAAACIVLSGCVGVGRTVVDIDHDALGTAQTTHAESLVLQTPAIDRRPRPNRLGRPTVTMFAITSGVVRSQNDVATEIADAVQAALSASGYTVTRATAGEALSGNARAIKAVIDEYRLFNYNWFFPLVPTTARVELSLQLVDSSGRALIERKLMGRGSSYQLDGKAAFRLASRKALTSVTMQIRAWASSEEFRNQLRGFSPS